MAVEDQEGIPTFLMWERRLLYIIVVFTLV